MAITELRGFTINDSDIKAKIFHIDDCRESKAIDIYLNKGYDYLDNTFTIPVYDYRVNYTPAFFVTLHNPDPLVGKHGDIIAIMSYQPGSSIDFSWIILSFVNENLRGSGIYYRLHNALEEKVVNEGWRGIRSGVYKDNTAMEKAAIKSNRKHIGNLYQWVPDF